MAKYFVIDIEANGLLHDATQIWCIVALDLEADLYHKYTYHDNFNGFKELYENPENTFIAHNGIGYDFPVIKRLLGLELSWKRMYDTLLISRMLHADRPQGHSLASYGQEFGTSKLDFKDFDKYSEEMLTYCTQDVRINGMVWERYEPYLEKYKQAIDIDREFAYYISLQEENGFTLDVEFATHYAAELESEREEYVAKIRQLAPPVKVKSPSYTKAYKEGRVLEESDKSYTYITEKTQVIKSADFKYEPFNPNSRQQIAEHFFTKYDWKPDLFTEKGAPDLSEKVLKTLPFEEAELLCQVIRRTKQLGMIRDGNAAWLKALRADNKVHGAVMVNGAVGGRCTHNSPNLAQCDRKDLRMRQCWIPKPGWGLVGADASGLELRLLAHYLANWDKGAYVHTILNADIHDYNREIMGLNKRDTAKTAIYGLIYGAGNEKLGKIVMADIDQPTTNTRVQMRLGGQVRNKIKDDLVGYKELLALIENTLSKRPFLVGIDGRPLKPRNDYSALNLLLQSAGASVMKKALNNFMRKCRFLGLKHGVDFGLCVNVHDEVQIESPLDKLDQYGTMFVDSIKTVTHQFKLNCPLDGEYKKGSNWSETH